MLSGHDDAAGVFQNMGIPLEGRKPIFAFSSAIAVINGVVGGAAVVGWIRYADVLLDTRAAEVRPIFPTPGHSHPTT